MPPPKKNPMATFTARVGLSTNEAHSDSLKRTLGRRPAPERLEGWHIQYPHFLAIHE